MSTMVDASVPSIPEGSAVKDPQSPKSVDIVEVVTPDGSPQPEMSTRERIRAKLRAQEKRLGAMVRSSSGDGNSIFTQMKNTEENLKQMETEKSQLEAELNKLKTATDGDDFLKEQMTGIQEGFEKQVKKIQSLEDEVLAKNGEIDNLQVELMRKLHKIVELEFDLETHEVHYTTYASEQFKLGEEALSEIKSQEAKGDKREEGGVPPARKSQKLISKLLSDLDSLEARYKQEKLSKSAEMEKVAIKNKQLITRLTVLERRLEEGGKHDEDISDNVSDVDMESVVYLRKRVETLEAKRFLNRTEMEKLKNEANHLLKDAEADAKKATNEIDRLGLENDATKVRIQTLEAAMNKKQKKKDEANSGEYDNVEKNIRDNYNYISKLESSLDIRDRQLATLKKELGQLKMKEIAHGRTEGHSQFDTDLARNGTVRYQKSLDDDQSGLTETTDVSYTRELQMQLRSAQLELVKKDQELVIERAKAASTAAGLLARITELSGRGVDNYVSSSSRNLGRSSRRESRRSNR